LANHLRRLRTHPPTPRRWKGLSLAAGIAASFLLLTLGVFLGSRLTANEPPSPEQHFQAGQSAYQRGDWVAAVKSFGAHLETEPNAPPTLLARARAYQQMGEFELAHRDYFQAEGVRPDGRARAGRAYCQARLKHFGVAAVLFEEALALGHQDAAVHAGLGYCYFQNRQLAEAQRALDQALALDGRLQAAYHLRARVDRDRTKNQKGVVPRQGLADIQRALEIGPVYANLYLDAAYLGAHAAAVEPAWNERTYFYLEQAIFHGEDPKALAGNPSFAAFWNQPRFVRLVTTTKPQHERKAPQLLLDPVRD
jgi:tetratricopeptide (TPR) repeat protein